MLYNWDATAAAAALKMVCFSSEFDGDPSAKMGFPPEIFGSAQKCSKCNSQNRRDPENEQAKKLASFEIK